jgi:hypothetical protein
MALRLTPRLGRFRGTVGIAMGLLAAGFSTVGRAADDLVERFSHPPPAARPWVYWYWMNAAVSREGIAADLAAMQQAGIGGAYLMPIKGPANPPWTTPPATQLSPAWWDFIRYAFAEADRRGIQLAMHACDGFSIGGGPWITPEQSMQKVVWSETELSDGRPPADPLPQPSALEGYYRDIAIFAFPSLPGSSAEASPQVTTSLPAADAEFLAAADNHRELRTDSPCWIQYAYARPFTCRTIVIRTPPWSTYQANRLEIQVSDDGQNFRPAGRLVCPRHGWLDYDAPVTHEIPPLTARYFRLVYDPAGSETGGEDLDSAKFAPALRVLSIVLSGAPRLDSFEGKSGAAWRISPPTSSALVPDSDCVPLDRMVDLTSRLQPDGRLDWTPPPGRWTVLRIGHTSTGHRNDTGGGAVGLECDKLSVAAAQEQFDHWFGAAIREVGPGLAGRVLKIFHVDSWECGSQNWTTDFREQFRRRRGYDLWPYLPALAGIPVGSAGISERFLRDVRATVAELVAERFFGTLEGLARAQGCVFSAESVAPTMVSDGMLHFSIVDIPMGEFWLRSPDHDKPNDILDAVSGAHIYGRPIAQAEAFTELRLGWDEQPALLKPLGDLNYARGINRFVYHVFVHNPWTDRKPGMTLNGVGTYFQRDQTWWKEAPAWVDYARRCQALLQAGRPAADIAVFTGEEIPRRAVLPRDLAGTLPGIIGAVPDEGDPLRGYAYDSINRDALLRLAQVRDHRIELPGGASYALLVIPGGRRMNPDGAAMTPEVVARLEELARRGATILWETPPAHSGSLQGYPGCDDDVARRVSAFWPGSGSQRSVGEGRIAAGPFPANSFAAWGLMPDFVARDPDGAPAGDVAWIHRRLDAADIYFVSNQAKKARTIFLSLRTTGRRPELWDPVTGERTAAALWSTEDGRTRLSVRLDTGASVFVVLREPTAATGEAKAYNWPQTQPVLALGPGWEVSFDPAAGGPAAPVSFAALDDWTTRPEPGIRNYSGTARYSAHFFWDPATAAGKRVWLNLGRVADLAQISLNGRDCGIAWTAPYRVEVTDGLHPGDNQVEIAVTNTWANRLIGDSALPPEKRITWTLVPFSLPALLPAGLLGPVALEAESPAPISPGEMQRVYEAVKTPYKYGIVLRPPPGGLVDCASVFRYRDHWYMMYVGNEGKIGYETYLARSSDLLHWTPLGKILPFSGGGWDRWQGDGGAALVDDTWGGSATLQPYDGKYWLSYLGGAQQGYETDPLSIGLAWSLAPDRAEPWTRLPENPVLSPWQPEARPFERKTLYKSQIIWDRSRTLGYPFVMFYNGKQQGVATERIGMAVSADLRHWSRFGPGPVVDNGSGISGDPQIVRMGDRWVMFYFGAGWKPHAFDTFACSRDLVHWTRWPGASLIAPSEAWDATFAHKPWLLKYNGIVYHFYCAVGAEGRTIALATSQPLR